MKKICTFALIAMCFVVSQAQKESKRLESNRETYSQYISKPLCIVLDTEDEKFVAKLERKGKTQDLKNYRELITTYNETIKMAAEQYLDVFSEIKYITDDEFMKMRKTEWKSNTFLRRSFPMMLRVNVLAPGDAYWTERNMEDVDLDPKAKKNNSLIEYAVYEKDMKSLQAIVSQPLCQLYCTKGEIFFAVRQLRKTFDDALNKTDSKFYAEKVAEVKQELKTRTLLINKKDLSPGLTAAAIKKVYPHSFKIVSDEEFDQELMAKNDNIIILLAISMPWNGTQGYKSHTFYNTSNEYLYRPHFKKCANEIKSEDFTYYLNTD